MSDYIQQQLDKALQLNRQRNQDLSVVKNTMTKRRGQYLMAISKEEKEQLAAKVNKFYDGQINKIYETIGLENPFTERKDEI
ncbi:hypothetical protein L9W92_18315 [Pelotomaculum terephthalicicum JT]|uniref:hypothetical protein n=1 Tax=Pelotomaculum terephthalicicum TaxID=206393 RepID=UPI001F038496|nr:hypothetical protein [Pelotomaculum terephthalicicum]MCG9969952.1 hypothetical protein [Pelotomaculum terephthalicicum JT]